MTRHTLLLLVPSALIACGLAAGQRANVDEKIAATPPVQPEGTFGKQVTGDGQLTEYVRRIFQDSRGHYWFGSGNDGIYHYTPVSPTGAASLEVFSTVDGLAGTQVTGIVEDRKGHIWISTTEGVSRYDPSTPLGTYAFTNYTKQDGLSSNSCWSLFEAMPIGKQAGNGSIWVGTVAGPCRFNGSSFEPLVLPMDRFSEREGYRVNTIAQDLKGDLWFGTDGGAFRYDGRSFQRLTERDGLGDTEVSCIVVDRKGRIWFGSMNGGLTLYNPSTGFKKRGRPMKHFTARDVIGNNEIWTVTEDREGDIWFSSEGYGVYRYDGKSLKNYSTKQGLGVLAVQTIHQDREGTMWFGGGGGLYRLEGDSMVHVTRKGPWR